MDSQTIFGRAIATNKVSIKNDCFYVKEHIQFLHHFHYLVVSGKIGEISKKIILDFSVGFCGIELTSKGGPLELRESPLIL